MSMCSRTCLPQRVLTNVVRPVPEAPQTIRQNWMPFLTFFFLRVLRICGWVSIGVGSVDGAAQGVPKTCWMGDVRWGASADGWLCRPGEEGVDVGAMERRAEVLLGNLGRWQLLLRNAKGLASGDHPPAAAPHHGPQWSRVWVPALTRRTAIVASQPALCFGLH